MGIYNYLVKKGAYITKYSNKYPLNRVLMDIFLKEEPYKQTNKEINWTLTKISLIIIVAL